MKRSPQALLPTPGEHNLLEILWRLGEGTIEDIVEASTQSPAPNYKTVQTLLRIMQKKNLVTHHLRGRAFVYTPVVRRDQVTRLSIRSILHRYFGGSRSELLLNLLEDEAIDLAELKNLEELVRQRRQAKQAARKPEKSETGGA